ncbi:MAG: hypothetical protein ABJF01_13145 [bacterium]
MSPLVNRLMRRGVSAPVFAFAAVACLTLTGIGQAQVRDSLVRPPAGAGRRQVVRAGIAQGQEGQQQGAANRPALERAVNQAVAKAVRRQLNLNDPQMESLKRVGQKFDVQRRTLLRDERATRQNLKAAMTDSAGPDQPRISQYIDQLTQVQHQRADLLAAEQKELSSFLTPMQRAQYLSLRERVTARVQQLAQPGTGVGGRAGGRRGLPPLER